MITEIFKCLIHPSRSNTAAQTWISIFIMLHILGARLGVDAVNGCTGYGVPTPGTPWTVMAEREVYDPRHGDIKGHVVLRD